MKSQEEIVLLQRVAQLKAEVSRLRADLQDIADNCHGSMADQAQYLAEQALKPYRGETNCTDCMTASHCETHHKEEGTYPFDEDA